MTEEERKARLAEMQKDRAARLREGMGRVERLEDASTQEQLDKWIAGEIRRFGGRPVEVDDAE